ncbi:MAG TPA: organic hydroperoxide resistance protein [Candidatus Dormibacteraeota bacterium]|jgi:Ohr subfamily peroxiredoxin
MATNTKRILYSAQAHVTGGRANGKGRTSDGALEVVLRAPQELGGPGGGTNPEQLFAIGYAACFESALQGVARRTKQDVGDIAIDSTVTLGPTAARGYQLGVTLDVHLPGIDSADAAATLVRAAHEVCPYSNATRGNIEVVLIANGRSVNTEVDGVAST